MIKIIDINSWKETKELQNSHKEIKEINAEIEAQFAWYYKNIDKLKSLSEVIFEKNGSSSLGGAFLFHEEIYCLFGSDKTSSTYANNNRNNRLNITLHRNRERNLERVTLKHPFYDNEITVYDRNWTTTQIIDSFNIFGLEFLKEDNFDKQEKQEEEIKNRKTLPQVILMIENGCPSKDDFLFQGGLYQLHYSEIKNEVCIQKFAISNLKNSYISIIFYANGELERIEFDHYINSDKRFKGDIYHHNWTPTQKRNAIMAFK
ncbi:hypothetical protein [Cytobacillus horneckiae]|uniref:hypothetical protein n=1 Tax=Cytobacillus horneckiae TaxID=549687 RepID=UPI002DB983B9|nr:hypothetical protein [Cytobacillus horneckiae]MEC1157841.1 hypothetical protein [Cytobacillus horneckiae]MED2940735.1 hypothetical protein [Cytobacillus horneckiae]